MSTTRDESTSTTIPLGAIGDAVGVPLLPDLFSRHQETTMASIELSTTKTTENANGRLLDFEIGDSDPTKVLNVQVYYDTFFRTFVFRDSGTPELMKLSNELHEKFGLDKVALKDWQVYRVADKYSDTQFVVAGWLGEDAPKKGALTFISEEQHLPHHTVAVMPQSGNVLIPNMAPGKYTVEYSGQRYRLAVIDEGRVEFTHLGTAADRDRDGVPDLSDNCPYASNPKQEDNGGLASKLPDGIGNACQCGDVTGDGRVDGQDATMISRQALGLWAPAFRVPGNCDVTGDKACNGLDATMIKRAAIKLSAPLLGNNCPNYTGR
jgi:hypothetical protein